MKVAVYIEAGVTQVVLTPESPFETSALREIERGVVSIKRGEFYECHGGWYRHGSQETSLMLRVDTERGE